MQLRSERRRNHHVVFVRDWITQLRQAGADFCPEAARDAGEAAYLAMAAGQDRNVVFQLARDAYYRGLRR